MKNETFRYKYLISLLEFKHTFTGSSFSYLRVYCVSLLYHSSHNSTVNGLGQTYSTGSPQARCGPLKTSFLHLVVSVNKHKSMETRNGHGSNTFYYSLGLWYKSTS